MCGLAGLTQLKTRGGHCRSLGSLSLQPSSPEMCPEDFGFSRLPALFPQLMETERLFLGPLCMLHSQETLGAVSWGIQRHHSEVTVPPGLMSSALKTASRTFYILFQGGA